MKVIYLIFLATILSSAYVLGQYTSSLGRFSVDEKKGCAEFTINILNTNLITVGDCTPGKPCVMEWGDGTANLTNTFQHVYTQPGTYRLRILYQTIGYDEIDITVTPNTQPAFDIYTCGNRTVQVKVTDTNYDSYIINYNDGSPEVIVPKGAGANDTHTYAVAGLKTIFVRGKNANAADNCTPANAKTVNAVAALTAPFIDLLTVSSSTQVDLDFNNASYSDNVQYRLEIAVNSNSLGNFQAAQTLLNVSSTSLSNVRTDYNYYCFRLGATDVCNSTTTYSNIICSSRLNLLLENNAAKLTWTTASIGGTNYDVTRDGTTLTNTTLSTYTDNSVVCNTTYCYQVVTNYTNGSESVSIEKCGTAFSTDVPTAINDITSVVGSTGVDLAWQQDPAFQTLEYSIFRKSGSGSFNLFSPSSTPSLMDDSYTTEGEYCYKINYKDICDNTSAEGTEVCPIRLTGKVNDNNSFILTWNAYNGWSTGVSQYRIEKYDIDGNLITTFSTTSLTYTDNTSEPNVQAYRYVVFAVPNTALLGESSSNEIQLLKQLNLFYPKAFTPNDDNLNDTFNVFGYAEFMSSFELKIFNRWGELLFTTESLTEGWDGRFRGSPQPEGTYAFTAKITDLAGRTFERTGSFVLLRK